VRPRNGPTSGQGGRGLFSGDVIGSEDFAKRRMPAEPAMKQSSKLPESDASVVMALS
jgi:hypothetical protein